MTQAYEPDGTPAGRNYTLYAYCLMSNHFHLLIRERVDSLAMAVKRIASFPELKDDWFSVVPKLWRATRSVSTLIEPVLLKECHPSPLYDDVMRTGIAV